MINAEKAKKEIIEHINSISFEELHQELIGAGLEEHQDAEDAINVSDDLFNFVAWKGYVTNINEDGTYDVELMDIILLGTREVAVISDEEIYGNPEIKLGSVFMMIVVMPDNNIPSMKSIKFQKEGIPETPEVYKEIAKRANELAEAMENAK